MPSRSLSLHRTPGRHWPGFLLPACLLLASISGQVPAQSADAYLARMDTDRDGRISLVEYQDWLSYGFDARDRDHDGILTTSESVGGRAPATTRDAYRARLAAVFAAQDRNHDGRLDARELAAPPR